MHKVAFIDRDGTINVDHGYAHTIEEWKWCDGVIDGLKLLQDSGYKLAVATNQGGIGLGKYTEQDLHKLHDYMVAELSKEGVTIDAIAYCPDHPDAESSCRKPSPAMAKDIEQQLGQIDYSNSWMVGDKEKDVGFGYNIGAQTALIKSKYWQDETELEFKPDLIVDSLFEFAQKIT